MSLFEILAPEATTNLITNPSVEIDATGYGTIRESSSIAAVTTHSRRGAKSLEVTPTDLPNAGCSFLLDGLEIAAHTLSFDFLGAVDVPYAAVFGWTLGFPGGPGIIDPWCDPIVFTGTGEWTRQHLHYTPDSTDEVQLYVYKNNSPSVAPFYVDGMQLEQKDHATTYVDGSLALSAAELQAGFVDDGVAWTGAAHASTSTRTATSGRGGVWTDLADDLYFYVETPLGLGAPPIEQARSQYANSKVAGSLYERSHERERVITLNGILMGTSLSTLETRRAALLALLQAAEPVMLRYSGADVPWEIACWYEGGLEGGVAHGHNERCSLRLIADYPYWREPMHHETHEYGGTDQISVAGLSGELADLQPVKAHDHTGDAGDGGALVLPNHDHTGDAGDGGVLTAYKPKFYPLAAPATSTAWDGDTKDSFSNGTIDLEAAFGLPYGVKAVLATLQVVDETTDVSGWLGPDATYFYGIQAIVVIANKYGIVNGPVTCDGNGDIYFYCNGELDHVYLLIWGYWL